MSNNICQPLDVLASCGDGVVDDAILEVCDHGGDLEDRACSDDCRTRFICGDGNQDPWEMCDDGNTISGDGCSDDCLSDETCGNGVSDAGELCDDGNNVSGDGCAADCGSDETCGNGLRELSEECDDANNAADDGCSESCVLEYCGDGIDNNVIEECDDAGESATCDDDCTIAACGDGRVNATLGEECDDSNTVAGDGCDVTCLLEYCGNGRLDLASSEVCDDGNMLDGDGCSATCNSDETCGNGVVDVSVGEMCDDGNLNNGDGCQSTCALATCGDGVVDPQEICDDGNNANNDGCSATCASNETCGNGVVDLPIGEGCDDGNLVSGDGCSAICMPEFCGNGTVDPTEACDDGNTANGDGCNSTCTSDETCGNGVLDPGEQCDDGNLIDDDGCDATCRFLSTQGEFLFVSDDGMSGTEIPAALMAEGHTVTVVLDDYLAGDNPALQGDIAGYDAIFWQATGDGLGSVHNPATFANLNAYVSAGGAVFVTGYDVIVSPTDPEMIQFLGGTSGVDVPGLDNTPLGGGANSLTSGLFDIQGQILTRPHSDHDHLTGLAPEVIVVQTGSGGAEWSLRPRGNGEIAWVSSGQHMNATMPAWTTPGSLYHEALLNFAFNH